MSAKPIHGEPAPFHVRQDLAATPPVPCDFKLGDRVIFTNDYGVKFERTVRAFSKELRPCNWGKFIYIFEDNSSWWSPVGPESLCHTK